MYGRACAAESSSADVIASCTRVIESSDSDSRARGVAHFNRGRALAMTGQESQALIDLDAAIHLVPGNAAAHGMRGVLHGQAGNLNAAIADFTASIKAEPTQVDSYTNRGKALQDKGEFQQAIPDFDRALQLQPDNGFALNGRCWSRGVLGIELDAALVDCRGAVQAGGPEVPNSLNSLGFVHYKRGEYREAIAAYGQSLEGNSKLASSHYMRGLARRAIGDAGAEADIQTGIELEPGVAQRYAAYGVRRNP